MRLEGWLRAQRLPPSFETAASQPPQDEDRGDAARPRPINGHTMPLIEFGEWAPDVIDLDTGESPTILNVVPQADGYGPFKSLQGFAQPLPAPCRGYAFARNA